MTQIPKNCLPIVEYIRENVPRPEELPEIVEGFYCVDGDVKECASLRFGCFCPMGLLKESLTPTPTYKCEFRPLPKGFTRKSIKGFWVWWDSLTDPQAAINAIWGDR